ncbi:MAG: class I SAM-dependent methyltransferase [Candidatus Nanoarchaeia archaeon]
MKAASAPLLLREMSPMPGDRILVVNAASGHIPEAILKKYGKTIDLTCTETNRHLMEMVEEKVSGRADIVRTRMTEFPFADLTFDIVLSICDIEFVKDKNIFLKNIRSLLKPRGRMILASYHPVGIMSFFRQLDWRCFNRKYFGRVDRKDILSLFSQSGLKLMRTKILKVLGDQEIILAKGVRN